MEDRVVDRACEREDAVEVRRDELELMLLLIVEAIDELLELLSDNNLAALSKFELPIFLNKYFNWCINSISSDISPFQTISKVHKIFEIKLKFILL